VSDADEAAERAVRELLARERPDDGFLGEEGSAKPGVRRWVIDALDGTVNFLRGDPFWCSAVALEQAGSPVVSAVHHLAGAETFSAVKGGGAHVGDERLRVADTRLAEGILATYWNPCDALRSVMSRVVAGTASTRVRGSGTLELAWLAAGRLDMWVQREPAIWDWMPGALLVTESGGRAEIVDVDGECWHVACSRRNWSAAEGMLTRRR
jgi:fructose-1,6-bisphosphatase/inositol monophosphatase family enzyme